MSVLTKLSLFAVLLAAAFALSFALGRAVPLPGAPASNPALRPHHSH